MRLSGTLALCWLALSPLAAAQTVVNHPLNTGVVATYTFDSGPNTAFFDYFDSGGSGSNYSNNSVAATSVVTFVAPPGRRIRVTFTAFQTETSWADRQFVYDGADTSAPIIPSANGAPGIIACAAQGWDGTTAPNNAGPSVLVSSGNALTFTFCSDSAVTQSGWAARVDLVPTASASVPVPSMSESALAALAVLLALVAGANLRRRTLR
jgi:CUB domain